MPKQNKRTNRGVVKKLVKKVNKIMREDKPERKHVFLDQTLTPPTSVEVFPTASVQHAVVLSQGVAGSQRLGNRVRGSHLNFNYTLVNFNNGVQINHMACRVMLVVDKRSNKLDIGLNAQELSALMVQSTVNGQYLNSQNVFNNEYKGRFKILYDKVHEIGRLTPQDPSNDTYVLVKKRIKCKEVMVFDKASPIGASSNITQGTIWLIYKPQQTENLGVLVPAPQMHWFIDYYFTDA